MVEPLSILDWKWDNDNTPPIQKVLIQWANLASKDTSWEEWNTLHTSYNLGDKVILPEEGVDSNPNPGRSRSKRVHKTPPYLQDYA